MFRPIVEFLISSNFLIIDTIKSKLKYVKRLGCAQGVLFVPFESPQCEESALKKC